MGTVCKIVYIFFSPNYGPKCLRLADVAKKLGRKLEQ